MRQLILPVALLAAAVSTAEARQVVTVAPRGRVATIRRGDDDRPMLGIVTSAGTRRDTLGLLVESVTPGSPADKAGLEEGNRIASINGVNLKVAKEDAGEPDMNGAMTNRLIREMRKVKAGDEVTLQVWADGHYKTVKVKTVAAKDLESRDDGPGDFGYAMNGMIVSDALPRVRAEVMNDMPRVRAEIERAMPRIREDIENEMPRIREDIGRDLPDAMDEVRRSMDRMRIEIPKLTMRIRHRVII